MNEWPEWCIALWLEGCYQIMNGAFAMHDLDSVFNRRGWYEMMDQRHLSAKQKGCVVTPPLKVGDRLRCVCGGEHAVELMVAGTPIVSCPEIHIGEHAEYPAYFHTGEILEVRRVSMR